MTSFFRKLATALMAVGVMSTAQAQQAPGDAKKLLSPQNSAVIMIDHQPQMAFAVQSIDRTLLTNNAVALAKTAKAFNVPTILTKKLVMAALWTEVCLVMPALAALEEGYEICIVTDASGGLTREAHDMAVTRMVQAGAVPITWMQLLLEHQRDWARQSTCDATVKIAIEHGGAHGTGLEYAKAMLGADAGKGKASKK